MTPAANTKSSAIPVAAVKPASKGLSRNAIIGIITAVAVVIGAGFGYRQWQFYVTHEETDDAQIEGHISPVLPRVSGYVSQVLVSDNQHVAAGQPLVEIDAQELDLKVSEADASQHNAVAELRTSEASLESAKAAALTAAANVETALVRQKKAAHDLDRDTKLFATGAITDSQLSDTQAAADTASATYQAVSSQVKTAEADVEVAKAKVAAAQTRAAELASELDLAKLQRSYASVKAPIAGIVSRKDVEPGQFVQAGQTLLSIASETDIWIVANFKETQLAHMKPGQPVEFEADTYKGYTFHGTVESISGATGARFALLPPDNSTGNFVKVTQRVPVKIVLSQAPDAEHPLRPGVSVDATVRTAE